MNETDELPWQGITRRIRTRMLDLNVRTAEDLAHLAGVNRSSLSLKMTGKRPFRFSDLQALSTALETTVSYLIGESTNREPRTTDGPVTVAPPHPELHRRLTFLGDDHAHRAGQPDGEIFDAAELEAIALRHDVSTDYLTRFDDQESADRCEALVEFTRAAREAGVQRINARSMGPLPASELRALARIIRSHAAP
ncbi:helix-turn-helix domain-containing protein [Microbacterium enclense]|uniref:helix-turn-helix domain-containing protein n=1 Tax=Microbacterium enclense TaxID=993073 RepID=UPI003F815C28